MTKRIYLDVCALCRPFDDQRHLRIRLESDAVQLILKSIQNKHFSMVVSPVHWHEIAAIAENAERIELTVLLNRFGNELNYDVPRARKRAETLIKKGLGVADAAHLSIAEVTADFFISCDDRLLKRYHRIASGILAFNPIEFCAREDLR